MDKIGVDVPFATYRSTISRQADGEPWTIRLSTTSSEIAEFAPLRSPSSQSFHIILKDDSRPSQVWKSRYTAQSNTR